MDPLEAQINAVLDQYYGFLAANQPQAIATQIFATPCTALGPSSVTALLTTDQIAGMFTTMLTALQGQGYVRSERQTTNICVLCPVAAVASTTYVRVLQDGTVTPPAGATYVFSLGTDGTWRISTLISHAANVLLTTAT